MNIINGPLLFVAKSFYCKYNLYNQIERVFVLLTKFAFLTLVYEDHLFASSKILVVN
jgi:hypothetical protein